MNTVLISTETYMGVSEHNNVAVVYFGSTKNCAGIVVYAVSVAMSGKDSVTGRNINNFVSRHTAAESQLPLTK